MSAKAKRILSLALVILFLMQSLDPVFARGSVGTEGETEIIQSKDSSTEEQQEHRDRPQNQVVVDEDHTITIPSEREVVEEVEEVQEPEEIPEEIPEEVVEEPEEDPLGQDLINGQSKIISYPKTSYRIFDSVDLRGLEIITKTFDGDVAHYTYADLMSDPSIRVSLRDGDYLPTQFYYSLFNPSYISGESHKTIQKIEHYLYNPIAQPQITIEIPNAEVMTIDLQLSGGELSPVELLHAIELPRGAAMVKNIGKLSYRPSESFNINSLELIYKNEKDQLQLLRGREIEKYFTIDDVRFEQDRSQFMEKVQSQVFEDLRAPIYRSTLDLTRFTQNMAKTSTPQVAESYVVLRGANVQDLFIPITLSNGTEHQSLDNFGNIEIIDVEKSPVGDRDIYKYKLDVKDISQMRELELQFTGQSQDIQVTRVSRTDGYRQQPVDGRSEEILTDDTIQLSTDLYAGNKYYITVAANSSAGDVVVKSRLSEVRGLDQREFSTSDLLGESQVETEAPEEPMEELPQEPEELPQEPTEEAPDTEVGDNEEIDQETEVEEEKPEETPEDKVEEENPEDVDQPEEETEEEAEETPEETEEPEETPEEEQEEPEEELDVPIEALEPSFSVNDLELFAVRASNEVTANLKVVKTDESGNPLTGATFNISGNGRNDDFTITNDNGTYMVLGLTPGTYTLSETKAPPGYEELKTKYRVVVGSEGNISVNEITENTLATEEEPEGGFLSSIFDFLKLGAARASVVNVTNYNMTPSTPSTSNTPTVKLAATEYMNLNLDLDVSDSATEGDTFEIKLDDQLVPTVLMPLSAEQSGGYTWTPPTIRDAYNNVIAKGEYNRERNTITYTFTDYVDVNKNVKVKLNIGNIGTNKSIARSNGVYEFTNSIDGTNQRPFRFNIDYGEALAMNNQAYDGKNGITEINPQKQTFRYVAYVNPDGRGVSGSTTFRIYENNEESKKILNLYGANVSFYRVPRASINQNTVPDSMMPDLNAPGITKVNRPTSVGNNGITATLTDTLNYAYVIIADIPINPNADAKEINVGFIWQGPGGWVSLTSYIGMAGSSGSGSGEEDVFVPQTGTVTVENQLKTEQKTGSFTINKVKENGAPLDGAKFELVSTTDEHFKIPIDGSINGKLEVNNIPPGEYILREVAAPEGYQKTDREWRVVVDSEGRVSIEELVTTSIEATESKRDVSDALEVDENSSADRAESTPTLDSIMANDSSARTQKEKAIELQGQSILAEEDDSYTPPTLTVENKPMDKGRFEIDKVGIDGSIEVKLPGAEFTLTDQSGNTRVRTSGSDGKVVFDGLEPGTYKLSETRAPEGYLKLNKTWTVTVDENGVTTVREDASTTGKRSKLEILGLSDDFGLQQLRALPEGTKPEDILIENEITNQKFGNSEVTTSAEYLGKVNGEDQFEVTLKVKAGADQVTPGPATDVVFLIQEPSLLLDGFTDALIDNIDKYGENTNIAIHVYNNTLPNLNTRLNFESPENAKKTVQGLQMPSRYNYPTATSLNRALAVVNNNFNGRPANKVLISFAENSIDSNTTLTNTVKSIKDNNVEIQNYYIGVPGNASTYMGRWNTIFGVSSVNASGDIKNNLTAKLPVYGSIRKKAVDNATFDVTFNNNFTFVGGSTVTSKDGSNTINRDQWHAQQLNGKIILKDGELTLNENTTGTMTFRVKPTGNLEVGNSYPIINKISYQPDKNGQTFSIDPPEVRINEGTINLTVKSNHTDPVEPSASTITFDLMQNGKFYGTYDVSLRGETTIERLAKEDGSGNAYKYTVENIKSSNPDVHITGTSEGPELNTIKINSEYRPGFTIDVDWGPLNPMGDLIVNLSNGDQINLKDSNYYYFNPEITSNYPRVESVAGEEGYIYTEEQNSDSSWTIKVRKNDSPTIKVINEKQHAKLTILKVDENDPTKVLQGAKFSLIGQGVNYEDHLMTEADGTVTFTDLVPGTYILKEEQPPVGYEDRGLEWKVEVTKDGVQMSITVTPQETDETKPVYEIYNPEGRLSTSGGYEGAFITQSLTPIDGTDRYQYKLYYDTRYPLNPDVTYNLAFNFNFDKFDIYYNGSKVTSNPQNFTVWANRKYQDQQFIYEVKPKNLEDGVPTSPISTINYGGLRLEDKYRPTLTKRYEKKDPIVLEPSSGENNVFEYSITNTTRAYNAEFMKYGEEKVEGEDIQTPLEGVQFNLFMKNEAGEFVDTDRKVTSDINGKITITGLYPGEYQLKESATPEGYLPIDGIAKEFRVEQDGIIRVKDSDGFVDMNDENKKIINIKSGDNEFTIDKKDENDRPLSGVTFELWSDDMTQKIATGTTDGNGKIVFKGIPNGYYKLVETSTREGYILADPIDIFLAVDALEFEVPDNPDAKDVSNLVGLQVTDWGTDKGSKVGTVTPNNAGSLYLKNSYTFPKEIRGGDYFKIQLSNNVDLHGLSSRFKNSNLDIIGPSGVIAKGEYDSNTNVIKYTFTDYMDRYRVTNATARISLFVDRYNVQSNRNIDVTQTLGNTSDSKRFYVEYTPYYGYYGSTGAGSMITKVNHDDKTFTMYVYVNPDFYNNVYDSYLDIRNYTDSSGISSAYFTNSDISNMKVWYVNNYERAKMPPSWGINESNLGAPASVSYSRPNGNNNTIRLHFNQAFNNQRYGRAAIVRIDGHFSDNNTDLVTSAKFFGHYWNSGYNSYYRDNFVKLYPSFGEGDGELIYELNNYPNKIEYTKVEGGIKNVTGEDGSTNAVSQLNPLAGAKFELRRSDGSVVNDSERISGEDGKFAWERLAPGKYEVWEIEAPAGYTKPNEAVSSFEVNSKGEVVNILNNSTIIINEKESMKFYLDKVWKDGEEDKRIELGTLELQLKAPEGQTFPDTVTADKENLVEGYKYKITEVSADKKTITLEFDLETAYEDKGLLIHVPSDWPSGDYTLIESKAPVGFMKTDTEYKISVNQTDKTINSGDIPLYEKTATEETLGVLKIVNHRGVYPMTGGMGTVLFAVLGVAMMEAATIGYKKKRGDV